MIRHIARAIATLFCRPYLSVRFPLRADNPAHFDVIANKRAIRRIDEHYKKQEKPLDPSMTTEEKALIFIDELDSRDRCKIAYERVGKPYLRVRLDYRPDGSMQIEEVHNRHAIYDIDQSYRAFGRDDYDFAAPEQDKIMMFTADMVGSAVPGYGTERVPIGDVPPEAFGMALKDLNERTPTMRDSPVRQIVDVAHLDRYGEGG